MRSAREAQRSPPAGDRTGVGSRLLAALAVVLGVVLAYRLLWPAGAGGLVVYCAHDALHAHQVLQAFERRTGIPVAIRYDTEAAKSLGLVELLIREASRPRCDVFWNNEPLGTLDLERRGLLEPYRGPGHARIPAAFKDPNGFWTGFAARLRVYIVNTDEVRPEARAVAQALAGDLSRVAIARPLYGTTLTHYTVLWDRWGRDRLIAWHRDWRRRGVREVPGNAAVRSLVGAGVCRLGLTDTDDFFAALDEGQPVGMVPVQLESGEAILIPNTVCILRGTRHLDAARRLVDFLLSAETELALARSRARQIPLGPVPPARLPPEVAALEKWVARSARLTSLAGARAACLAWLKSEPRP